MSSPPDNLSSPKPSPQYAPTVDTEPPAMCTASARSTHPLAIKLPTSANVIISDLPVIPGRTQPTGGLNACKFEKRQATPYPPKLSSAQDYFDEEHHDEDVGEGHGGDDSADK